MVKAVPLRFSGAYCATNVENCGESGLTLKPQIKSSIKKKGNGSTYNRGEIKQQSPDMKSAVVPTFALPKYCER